MKFASKQSDVLAVKRYQQAFSHDAYQVRVEALRSGEALLQLLRANGDVVDWVALQVRDAIQITPQPMNVMLGSKEIAGLTFVKSDSAGEAVPIARGLNRP